MKRKYSETNLNVDSGGEEEADVIKQDHDHTILILDQTLESNHLVRKFRYLTMSLQLFMQSVPVLKWFPWDIVADIEPLMFNATMRIGLHGFSSKELLEEVLKIFTEVDENIFNPYEKLHILKDLPLQLNDNYQTKQRLVDLLKNLLNDKMYMLEAVRFSGAFKFASDELKDDLDVVLQAVKGDAYSIRYATERFQNNEMVVMEAVKSNNYVIEFVSKELRDNERIILEAVKNYRFAIQHASERLRNDENFALQVVQVSNECVLELLSEKFKDNEQIVLEAVKKNTCSIQYASDKLKDNRAIAIEAVRKCGWIELGSKQGRSPWFSLGSLSERLKSDKEIELLAVTTFVKEVYFGGHRNQKPLESTKKECIDIVLKQLLQDNLFMKEAIKKNCSLLEEASDLLKDDEEFILELVKNNGYSFCYASKRLKNDKEMVKKVISISNYECFHIPETLKHDREFIIEIFKERGYLIDNSLCDDEQILMEAINNNFFAIQYASARLITLHRELVLKIYSNNAFEWGTPIYFPRFHVLEVLLSEKPEDEREIIEKLIENNSALLLYVSSELKDDRDIVLKAVGKNGELLKYVSGRLKDDREVVLKAVLNNGLAFQYASKRWKDDREILLAAIKNSPLAIQYAGVPFRNVDFICDCLENFNQFRVEKEPLYTFDFFKYPQLTKCKEYIEDIEDDLPIY